jgi:hypothetical protein
MTEVAAVAAETTAATITKLCGLSPRANYTGNNNNSNNNNNFYVKLT